MQPILMSKENPNGYKLEELLEQVSHEMILKNEKIKHDTSKVSAMIRGNNFEIISHISRAKQLQEETYKMLAEIGKDQGPKGHPRIG